MRRRAFGLVTAACSAALLTACSLLVSTSGLSTAADAPPAAAEGGADSSEAAASPVDAAVDANDGSADTGVDAAVDPHLLAEYRFDDAPGMIAHDTSGNLRDALLQGDVTFVADGAHGRALALNGGAGGGFLVVDGLAGTVAFPASGTLSLWFRWSFSPSEMTERSIFDDYDTTRHHLFIRRVNTDTGTVFQVAAQVTSSYAYATDFDVQPNTWTHCVLTWDAAASRAAFYVNGALIAEGAYELKFDVKGQQFRMGDGLIGGLDDVRLFDRVFTAAEVGKLD